MHKPRKLIVNGVSIHIVWSKRMTKSRAKIIVNGKHFWIQLSEPLLQSKEDISDAVTELFHKSALILTDDKQLHVRGKKMGSGGFSSVYLCADNPELVIKTNEYVNLKNFTKANPLKNEILAYTIFEKANIDFDKRFVPKYHGCSGDECILLERYHTDLRKVSKIMDDDKINAIIIDIITSLEFIHSSGLVHCDVKQGNVFLDSDHRAVLGDFGFSKPYITKPSGISYTKSRYGTLAYMSRDVHDRIQPTRRTDIETLGWVIIELLKGVLPWKTCMSVDTVGLYKHNVFRDVNKFLSECFVDAVPPSIIQYLNYVQKMAYHDEPHYVSLKQMFSST